MTLINRVTRLFKADMHGILDCLEDPKTVLKQAVREMEEELEKLEKDRKEQVSQEARLGKQIQETKQGLEKNQQELEFCLGKEDESLARSCVKKRLAGEKRVKALEKLGEGTALKRKELEKREGEYREKLNSIVEKMKLVIETCGEEGWEEYSDGVSEEEIQLAYLKEKESWDKGGRTI